MFITKVSFKVLLGAVFLVMLSHKIEAMLIPVHNCLDKAIEVSVVPAGLYAGKGHGVGVLGMIIQPGAQVSVCTLCGYKSYEVRIYDDVSAKKILFSCIDIPGHAIKKISVFSKDNIVKLSIEKVSETYVDSAEQGLLIGGKVVPYYDWELGETYCPGYNNGLLEVEMSHKCTLSQNLKTKGAFFYSPVENDYVRLMLEEEHQRYSIYGIFEGCCAGQVAEYFAIRMPFLIHKKLAGGINGAIALQHSFHELDGAVRDSAVRSSAIGLIVLFDKREKVLYTMNNGHARALLLRRGHASVIANGCRKIKDHVEKRHDLEGTYCSWAEDLYKKHAGLLGLHGNKNKCDCLIACDMEPEATITDIGHDRGILVLASKALWAGLGDHEIVNAAHKQRYSRIAKTLVAKAKEKGNTGNMLSLVIKVK